MFHPADAARFQQAISRFDAENAQDPSSESENGVECPRELLYARRLSDWVLRIDPNASEALRLAARCQHIRRWTIPRETYPMTKPGYLKWRQDLKEFHASLAGEILAGVGYDPTTIGRVKALNLKRDLSTDSEVQILEDALCLVFLEHQLLPLMNKTSEEKVVDAVRKSWGKMSPRGREIALGLPLDPAVAEVVRRALNT